MQVTSRSSKPRCSSILWTGKWSLDPGIPWSWPPRCLCDHLFYWIHVPGNFESLWLLQAGPSAGRVFVPLLHLANCSLASKPNGCSSVWSLPFPLPMKWSPISSCHLRTLTALPRQPHKLFDPPSVSPTEPWAPLEQVPWTAHFWFPRACTCSTLLWGKKNCLKCRKLYKRKGIHRYY